jgi:hypothetical protein
MQVMMVCAGHRSEPSQRNTVLANAEFNLLSKRLIEDGSLHRIIRNGKSSHFWIKPPPAAYPLVWTAPVPAGAQFLNLIESVFSGMSRAIIHNSDYASLDAAKDAIDLYFRQRNEHFSGHPKRAGHKIYGKERVPSEFQDGQNCKDPANR